MSQTNVVQVFLQLLDRGVAFSLVACGNDEDKRLGLGACLEEFINQAICDAQSQAAEQYVNDAQLEFSRLTYLFAPVTRT